MYGISRGVSDGIYEQNVVLTWTYASRLLAQCLMRYLGHVPTRYARHSLRSLDTKL